MADRSRNRLFPVSRSHVQRARSAASMSRAAASGVTSPASTSLPKRAISARAAGAASAASRPWRTSASNQRRACAARRACQWPSRVPPGAPAPASPPRPRPGPCSSSAETVIALGKPVGVLRAAAQQAQRAGIIGAGAHRRGLQLAIGLVHQDQVGHLHDPALDALQLVPARRGQQQHEQIAEIRHHGFGLAHAHRLDQHHVEPRRLAQRHRLARAARHAAELRLRRARGG